MVFFPPRCWAWCLVLVLILMLFSMHGNVCVLFREDMLILNSWALDVRWFAWWEVEGHTTMSSDLSSYSYSWALHILDENLQNMIQNPHTHTQKEITHLPTLLPHLLMLPTQHLGVNILSRHGPQIGLSSNLDTMVVGEVYERVCVEWVEVTFPIAYSTCGQNQNHSSPGASCYPSSSLPHSTGAALGAI